MAKLDIECCPICCAPVKAIETCNSVRFEYDGPRWISVEERLPEHGKYVLCWYSDIDGGEWHTVGKLLTNGIWALDIYETDEPEYYTVTHWMPLPEPPKEVPNA